MHIELQAYSGPMELLLALIEKNKIDIYDIPIAQITDQYMEQLNRGAIDMDNISEFLVMAATLLLIKSRMLLPAAPKPDDEDEDPREALVQKLLAYKRCQELAEILRGLDSPKQAYFRPAENLPAPQITAAELLGEVTPADLWRLFEEALSRKALKADKIRQGFGAVKRDTTTVADKIALIKSRLQSRGKILLSRLFAECQSKRECIVTFLALLEVIKARDALVRQVGLFGEVEVEGAIITPPNSTEISPKLQSP